MHFTAFVVCCLTAIHAVTNQNVREPKETVKQPQIKTTSDTSSGNNIAFELPDLTAQEDTEQGEIQLEAFKATQNDRILQERKMDSIMQLYWVSIGHPKLLRMRSKHNASVWNNFRFKREGFYTRVQMMTPEHKKLLSETASRKYNLRINSTQIKHLILSQFECNIELYEKDRKYIITGAVGDFRRFPLRMDFRASMESRERRMFSERLEFALSEKTEDIELICKLASSGKELVRNTLVITSELSQNLGLADKLFGPVRTANQTVYVTRHQLNSLSAEIYSALKVVEEYEMPEYKFKEDFIDELVKMAAVGHFQQVSFNQALRELSTFGFDFSGDLKADEVQRDFGNILKVRNYNNKSHIVVNDEHLADLRASSKFKGDYSSNYGVSAFFYNMNIGSSLSIAQSNSIGWKENKKSVKDQLLELNSQETDDVKWMIEGNKVIPKSVNVVKITQGSFMKTMVFKRIRRHSYEAPYHRKLRLYTEESVSGESDESLRKQFQSLRESDETQRKEMQRLKESNENQRKELKRMKDHTHKPCLYFRRESDGDYYSTYWRCNSDDSVDTGKAYCGTKIC